MHVIAYLGLPEVTMDVTNLGTNAYCLAEMGVLVSYLVTMKALLLRTFPELLLLEMLPCTVGEGKKPFIFVFFRTKVIT